MAQLIRPNSGRENLNHIEAKINELEFAEFAFKRLRSLREVKPADHFRTKVDLGVSEADFAHGTICPHS